MPLNKNLLNKILLNKEGYAPPNAAPGMPGMDPTMMDPSMLAAGGQAPGGPPMPAGGGAAPMDPAMMGGAPPMPGMPDPAAAGGMPPMDPSMVGGLPGPGGGDPAAAGGMPPDVGGGMPIQLNAEDLMALFEQVSAGAGGAEGAPEEEEPKGRTTNTELAEQVDSLSTMVGQLMSHFNLTPAEGMSGMGEEPVPGMEAGMPGMDPMAMGGEGGMPELPPEAMAALGGAPDMAAGGMPPPEMMDMGTVPMEMGGPQKMASDNRAQLVEILGQMNDYK